MARQHLTQRKDGRYACKYHGKLFMGRTQREALEARDAYKLQEKQGMRKDADHMTVAEYAAEWLPIHKASVSNKCYNDYAKQLDALIDTIGDKVMKEVTPTDIQRVWLHYSGYSSSTTKRSRQLFFSIFDTACDDGYIRTNPMKSKHAQPPAGYSGTHRAITPQERELILCNGEHFFHLAVMVMLYAGLRRGEVLALDIDRDVDFINHCIYVRQAVRYDSNQPIISDPKTKSGVRSVPMVSILENALRGHSGLVAPARRSGAQMSESAFKSAWHGYFNAIEYKLNGSKNHPHKPGQPWQSIDIRPHDLRHSYCTMLRDAGVDIKLAMQWMGHADEKMILRIYDHVSDFRTKQAMDSIEKMLDGMQTGMQTSDNVRESI